MSAKTPELERFHQEYVPEARFAEVIEKDVRTLRDWRAKRVGPPFVRIGRTIFYSWSAWLAHLEANQVKPRRSA